MLFFFLVCGFCFGCVFDGEMSPPTPQEQPALSAGGQTGRSSGTGMTAPPGGSSSPHLSEAPPSTPGAKPRTGGREREQKAGDE